MTEKCKDGVHSCQILSGSDYQYWGTSYSCLIEHDDEEPPPPVPSEEMK